MDKKHILIISFAYPPLPAIGSRRIAMIAKELHSNGYVPHVITAKNPPQTHDIKSFIPEENVHHVNWFDIWQLKHTLEKYKLTKILGKILGYFFPFGSNILPERRRFFWIQPAVKKGLELIKKHNIELIYSSYTPPASIRIAAKLKEESGIPWINEYRDLWTGNPYLNLSEKQKAKNYKKEKELISKADALVTVSEPLKRELIVLHKKPTFVIYNGIDQLATTSGNKATSKKIKIVYAGTIYKGKRDPLPLFLALKRLKEKDNSLYNLFKVDFYGPAMEKLLYKDVIDTGVGDVVSLKQPVSHKEILDIQANANILLLLGWNNIADEGVLTGKIFEYLGMYKPILAMGYKNGAMDVVLKETKTGRIINSPEEICNYLIDVAKIIQNNEKIELFKSNIMLDSYLRKRQVVNLIKVFDKTLTNKL